jgi:hypothetical protein
MRAEDPTVEDLEDFGERLQRPLGRALRDAGSIMNQRLEARGLALLDLTNTEMVELLFGAFREGGPQPLPACQSRKGRSESGGDGRSHEDGARRQCQLKRCRELAGFGSDGWGPSSRGSDRRVCLQFIFVKPSASLPQWQCDPTDRTRSGLPCRRREGARSDVSRLSR